MKPSDMIHIFNSYILFNVNIHVYIYRTQHTSILVSLKETYSIHVYVLNIEQEVNISAGARPPHLIKHINIICKLLLKSKDMFCILSQYNRADSHK